MGTPETVTVIQNRHNHPRTTTDTTMKRADVVFAVETAEWFAHISVGFAFVFVVSLVVAASTRVPLVLVFGCCFVSSWQMFVPSHAIGWMRAKGLTSRDLAGAVFERVPGYWVIASACGLGGGKRNLNGLSSANAHQSASFASASKSRTSASTDEPLPAGRRKLPPVNMWPHRPVFVRSSPRSVTQRTIDGWASANGPVFRRNRPNARADEREASVPVNTETAMEFETELFAGKILCRFKGVDKTTAKTPESFYSRKRCTFQVLVQGKFKERVRADELVTGGEFYHPFENVPPKSLVYAGQQFFMQLTPGLEVDMLADPPYYYAPMASTVSILAAHEDGRAPDITSDIGENTRLFGGKFAEREVSLNERSRIFSDAQQAAKYEFNTEDVYTFDYFQNVLLFDDYCLDIGIAKRMLHTHLVGQPINFFAKTKDGRYAYSFEIWHQSLLLKAKERTPMGAPWPPKSRTTSLAA
jgi:hypothetical protein